MGLQAQHNGSRRRLLFFLIEAVLGQHNMYASLLDRLNLLNCACQLSLKCLQIVDTILKLGDTKLAVVEDFKTLVPARQTLGCKVQTCLVNVRRRNEDRRARLIFLHLVGNVRFAQLIGNLTGILGLHVGKQRHHIGLAAIPKTHTKDEDENCECRTEHDVALPLVKAFPHGTAALFPLSHNLFPFKSSRCDAPPVGAHENGRQ